MLASESEVSATEVSPIEVLEIICKLVFFFCMLQGAFPHSETELIPKVYIKIVTVEIWLLFTWFL